nr:hypothetical protein [Actinomycetota bacterium]
GLAWGVIGAAAGTRRARDDSAAARPERILLGSAAAFAAVWLLALALVSVATGNLVASRLAGLVLLAVAFAPNVVSAVVALGCGAGVELAAYGFDGEELRALDGVALWDWYGGVAPWYVVALVVLPLAATVLAATAAPAAHPLRRGLRNGLVLGSALLVLGWAGSYAATVRAAGDEATVRLGIDLVPAFFLGVAWGVGGSFLAARLPQPDRRPRVEPP